MQATKLDKDRYIGHTYGDGKGETVASLCVKMKMDVRFSFAIKVATTSSLSIIVYQ